MATAKLMVCVGSVVSESLSLTVTFKEALLKPAVAVKLNVPRAAVSSAPLPLKVSAPLAD